MAKEHVPTGISGDFLQRPYVDERQVSNVADLEEAYLEGLAKKAQSGDARAEAQLAQIYSSMVSEGYN